MDLHYRKVICLSINRLAALKISFELVNGLYRAAF